MRARAFVDECAIHAEDLARAHDVDWLDATVHALRGRAALRGLVAPQLPVGAGGLGLCWQDCARVFEELGRSFVAAGALGCQAPERPNVDTLLHLASPSQRERWLGPLMTGAIRSAFAMTEPAPAIGSDPRMLATTARRESFGTRLAEHPQVQAMIADAHIDLYACRLMTADVARRLDEGESIRHHSSMAKVFVSEALNRVADRACQLAGAGGMCTDGRLR